MIKLARIGRSADQPKHRSAVDRGTPKKSRWKEAATTAKNGPDEAGDAELGPWADACRRAEAPEVDDQRRDKEQGADDNLDSDIEPKELKWGHEQD